MQDGLSAIYVAADKLAGKIIVTIVPCFDGGKVIAGKHLVPADSIEHFVQLTAAANADRYVRRAVAMFHQEEILFGELRQAISALREYDERQASRHEQS